MYSARDFEDYKRNAILRALPPEELLAIRRSARKVQFQPGDVVYGAGECLQFVYFPTTCVVAHCYTTREGMSAAMALTGRDGMVGLPVLLGSQCAAHAAVAQIGGTAWKVPAASIQADFAHAASLQRLVLRYTQMLITELAQTAACNRLHPLDQRMCRWLLLCFDRVDEPEILMTQESMASMVGGRRESITHAAGRLQDLGIIRYSRGHIRMLERRALQALVCECYGTLAELHQAERSKPALGIPKLVRTPGDLRLTL